ncbi:MAG: toll/interleukin-1 receptor domain-containing protein [Gemmatimonadetes bacterium]|nr:toll/interleukin-1 receptor domain-containing protein [Gemmatimonadota bacterium]MYB59545.1 toll/interleukin-1 receptor domain-containing protein [Gemmatimonadota bacterium]
MGKKVFLSYAYQDSDIAEKVSRLLEEHGHDTDDMSFIDPQVDTKIGDDIRKAIKQQMCSASNVVIIVTPNSAKSQWVNYEAGMASALDKPIILIKSKDAKDVDFVTSLANAQSIEIGNGVGEQ